MWMDGFNIRGESVMTKMLRSKRGRITYRAGTGRFRKITTQDLGLCCCEKCDRLFKASDRVGGSVYKVCPTCAESL